MKGSLVSQIPVVDSTTATSSEYQPTSRRPIAGGFRATAALAVKLCLQWNVHPDVISYLSMVAAAGAGLCFWGSGWKPWLLIVGPLLCYVRLWMNMLDGMVALAAGKASSRGEILNDLPDRVSDVLIFAGMAHSGWCAIPSGYWAAIMALIIAYVGMFGQAVGVQRQFGGIMSKPWRMVLLHAGAWLTLALLWWNAGNICWASLTVLDWTCLIVVAGGMQTIFVRLRRILALLAAKRERCACL
jgi:phosphatidylglycerophosphate synthase